MGQKTEDDAMVLTDYVNDHIAEIKAGLLKDGRDVGAFGHGKSFPIKSADIFGETKKKDELKLIINNLQWETEDGKIFGRTLYYIDSLMGRLYVTAGLGSILLQAPDSFYIDVDDNDDDDDVIIESEDKTKIQEQINQIKKMPNPSSHSDILSEIKQCYVELKKDNDSDVDEALKDRVIHLINLLVTPSADLFVATIQEYTSYEQQVRKSSMSESLDIADEWQSKIQELIDYAKLHYLDNASVKNYFTALDNAALIAKKAKLIEILTHIGILQ